MPERRQTASISALVASLAWTPAEASRSGWRRALGLARVRRARSWTSAIVDAHHLDAVDWHRLMKRQAFSPGA